MLCSMNTAKTRRTETSRTESLLRTTARMNGPDGMTSAPLDKVDETLHHKPIDVVVVAVVYAVDRAQPTVPACPLTITYPTLGEGSALPRRGARSGSRPKPTDKGGEHDSKLPECMGRPNMKGAPRLRARVEMCAFSSPSSSSKSAQCDRDTSTTARGARILEVRKNAIPMRILSKGSVGTCPDTPQRKAPQIEEHMRRNNGPTR